MNNKAVLVTAVIASILVVGMISPIGLAYAHVNVCSPSNDHDKDGISFSALWAAVCDLQSQIDSLQNQINNLHGGTQSNVISKEVQLSPSACTSIPPASVFSYGWCPDGNTQNFLIHDDAVGPNSVIVVNTVSPNGNNNAGDPTTFSIARCSVESINIADGANTGFLLFCDSGVRTGTLLNYIIFNPATTVCTLPQVLQNGVCVTPPPTCTPPQVLDTTTNTCIIPPPTCTPPKVLDKTTNTCIIPTHGDDDKDKKPGDASQFSNYKNENKH